MGRARESACAGMPSSALGSLQFVCVCSDNLLLPRPLRYLLAADTGVMWRPCFQWRCASLISCSFLACICVCTFVCVCPGEILGSICTASPAVLWPSVFSFLSCVTQQVVLCCAIRIAQQCMWEGTNSKRALPSSGKYLGLMFAWLRKGCGSGEEAGHT